MTLSIVVPTYNVEAYLANCLESLVNQDISPNEYEILVVNDGSTDSSPQIAKDYANRYDHITVINQENKGLSGARNTGIRQAKGKYIYFIDSDDYLAHNSLGYAIGLMNSLDLDILCLSVQTTPRLDLYASSNSEVKKSEKIEVIDGISFLAGYPYLNNAWWYLIRRDYLTQSGLSFPPGRYFEDCIFTASLLMHANRIARTDLDFYRYVIRPDSIMNRKSKDHILRLIGDYEKNVYDMQPLLNELLLSDHPRANECLLRLDARQQSFVFFMLVLCIRSQLGKEEVQPILNRLDTFNAYPIKKILLRYYRNKAYPLLRYVMNHRSLLFASLKVLPFTEKVLPKVYLKINRMVRMAS